MMRRYALGLVMVATTGAVLPASAQDLPHPRNLGLDGTRFTVPDTSRFRFRLSNGLIGFVVTDASVPIIQLSAFIRVGTGDGEKQGLAEFIAMSMRRGPCWMGYDRFRDALDAMAGSVSVSQGTELTEVTMSFAAEDAAQGIRIFSGIVREPCIDRDAIARFQQAGATPALPAEGAGRGSALLDAPADAALDAFRRRLFQGHAYDPVVTAAHAAALTVDDLERFQRDFFTPANLVLAVSGFFRREELLTQVDQRFADWQERFPGRLATASPVRTSGPDTVRYTVDKLQTWVVMGHELPPVRPQDLPALQVMNYILGGGHFDTRLFRVTRDQRGLTNDATGYLETNLRGPGTYTFRTSGRPGVVAELMAIVRAEIERIQTELVTEDELFVAKGALIDGDLAMGFAHGHAAARTLALEFARYGTFRYLVDYAEQIDRVSAGDVRRAARDYLHPDRLLVVLVGPGS